MVSIRIIRFFNNQLSHGQLSSLLVSDAAGLSPLAHFVHPFSDTVEFGASDQLSPSFLPPERMSYMLKSFFASSSLSRSLCVVIQYAFLLRGHNVDGLVEVFVSDDSGFPSQSCIKTIE